MLKEGSIWKCVCIHSLSVKEVYGEISGDVLIPFGSVNVGEPLPERGNPSLREDSVGCVSVHVCMRVCTSPTGAG